MYYFFSQVIEIISKIKSYDKYLHYYIIIIKVLISLTLKFNHVIIRIEELKDLFTFLFD